MFTTTFWRDNYMSHPYKFMDNKAFWKRAVASSFENQDLIHNAPYLKEGDKFGSAGSCFAGNIIPYLEAAGFEYIRHNNSLNKGAISYDENFNYHLFSAAYGNLYTAQHLLQIIEEAMGIKKPVVDRWYTSSGIVDPYRPGLKYLASCDVEFDLLKKDYLRSILSAFTEMDVFVFTLGLTEAWVCEIDDTVFPACPGTISGKFDPSIHKFKNYTVTEITTSMNAAFSLLREINPELKIIVTVSPVPLVATATNNHVVTATTYSKSVLRVAAEEICQKLPYVKYFPSYEIVTGPQAPFSYFEQNRRDVSKEAIDAVMEVLVSSCGNSSNKREGEIPVSAKPKPSGNSVSLSEGLANVECEEAAADI
jgi:hypothetical protein